MKKVPRKSSPITPKKISDKYQSIIDSTNEKMSQTDIMSIIHRTLEQGLVVTQTYKKDKLQLFLYRVSRNNFVGFDPCKKECLSHPPTTINGEPCKVGRANIKGHPVLYVSTHPKTAVEEMKEHLKSEEKFYISKWVFEPKENINVHDILLNKKTQVTGHLLSEMVKDHKSRIANTMASLAGFPNEDIGMSVEALGDLYTSKDKNMYYLTSAYSHFVLYDAKKQRVDIKAILYPSVEANMNGINYAIHPDLVDTPSLYVKEVFEVSLNTDLTDPYLSEMPVKVYKKGVFNGEEFQGWEEKYFQITNIKFNELQVITKEGLVFKGNEACDIKLQSDKAKIADWVETHFDSPEKQDELAKMSFPHPDSPPLSSESRHYEYHFTFYGLNLLIITPMGEKILDKLTVPVSWVVEYRKIKM